MSSLHNVIFKNQDPFDTDDTPLEESKTRKYGMVHIRNQQRNGRKSLTQISGLATDLDLVKIVKDMKKIFNTNGAILKDDDGNEIIQIQGDRRIDCRDFLTKYNICEADIIKIHGA